MEDIVAFSHQSLTSEASIQVETLDSRSLHCARLRFAPVGMTRFLSNELQEQRSLKWTECYVPAVTRSTPANFPSDASYGARAIPRSVTIAVTYFAGVTSNAGFSICTPSGVICFPAMWVTSFSLRCSMGILLPSGVSKSMVERGAAT